MYRTEKAPFNAGFTGFRRRNETKQVTGWFEGINLTVDNSSIFSELDPEILHVCTHVIGPLSPLELFFYLRHNTWNWRFFGYAWVGWDRGRVGPRALVEKYYKIKPGRRKSCDMPVVWYMRSNVQGLFWRDHVRNVLKFGQVQNKFRPTYV